jgi:broad specificity phosphatase PhoE
MPFRDATIHQLRQLVAVAFAFACGVPQPARIAPANPGVTTIVVVRHADRSTDDPRDPSLSPAGQQRARDLGMVLRDAGVTDIYTTQYKRTRQTAEPYAQLHGISILERPIGASNSTSYAHDLAQEILTRSAGKSVLVVGHSNTVPDIVRALSGIPVPAMTDAEYDHIFVVVVPATGSPRVMQLRFGNPCCVASSDAASLRGDTVLGNTVRPHATLALSTPPDFTGTVAKIEFESANGPAGPYSQHNVWLVIPPSATANAGLVVAKTTPVFVRTRDGILSSDASGIRVGDRVEVWRNIQVAYGAVQGPPGAPTYENLKQIVIDR